MDILYGRNPVLEALRAARPARKLVVAEGIRDDARLTEIRERARSLAIPVETSSRRRLDDIAHTEHHQGVAGYFHARAPLRLETLIERARKPALMLVLDGIQDPQNLGAIARTAEACGADGIVLARRRAASVTPAAAKASAGATEHVPLATVVNIAQALDVIAEAGIWRVGLDAAARMRYDEYLQAGYPIASGVIEGACRHVVKDRMEHGGMRWTLPGAQAMLDVRCVCACSEWDNFGQWRQAEEAKRVHRHRALVANYQGFNA